MCLILYISLCALLNSDNGNCICLFNGHFSVLDGVDAQSEDCILTTYSKVNGLMVHCYVNVTLNIAGELFQFMLFSQWDQIQELLGHPMEKPVVLHR